MSSIGNLFTIFGSIFFLADEYFPSYRVEEFLGFGCLITWASITRYFSNTRDYALISRTFSIAIPLVMKVVLGWVPVFFAFTFFGVCMFWTMRGYFDNLPNSFFALFAVMNGDSVGDVFYGSS